MLNHLVLKVKRILIDFSKDYSIFAVDKSMLCEKSSRLLQLKMQYIPRCAQGAISIRKCAKQIGITPQSVCRLKKRYQQYGDAIFIHGNTGRTPKNRKYNSADIVAFYNNKFSRAPFAVVAEYYPGDVSYSTLYNALTASNIVSPRARIPVREKKKHLPRKERPHEGELLQMDASRHEWLIGQPQVVLHGGIDDATHKLAGLYLCVSESLMGYIEILQQTRKRFGGMPQAAYTDRAPYLYNIKHSTEKVSIQEQAKEILEGNSQWQQICRTLNIELIIALSPQAKGRIERLWQTLQGRLPFIFRFLGIDTIEKANEYLAHYVDEFNKRFSVPAQEEELYWQPVPTGQDLEYLLSVRTEKRTKSDGTFIYHGYTFQLDAPRKCCVKFVLALNVRYGIRAYMNNAYYPVKLCDPISDVYGDPMPKIEKELIYSYFYTDLHSGCITLSG